MDVGGLLVRGTSGSGLILVRSSYWVRDRDIRDITCSDVNEPVHPPAPISDSLWSKEHL